MIRESSTVHPTIPKIFPVSLCILGVGYHAVALVSHKEEPPSAGSASGCSFASGHHCAQQCPAWQGVALGSNVKMQLCGVLSSNWLNGLSHNLRKTISSDQLVLVNLPSLGRNLKCGRMSKLDPRQNTLCRSGEQVRVDSHSLTLASILQMLLAFDGTSKLPVIAPPFQLGSPCCRCWHPTVD